jgi:hypothetical protein
MDVRAYREKPGVRDAHKGGAHRAAAGPKRSAQALWDYLRGQVAVTS